ncbi:MAG: YfhO family protein [Sphingomonadales bacterium]|nr:YfhO family protein [Sphingomonadales bacterium]
MKIRSLLRSDYALAAAVLIAAWFVLSSPWLLGHVTIPYDAKAHFQAQIQFLSNALHSGQSPFWAPYVFVGTPQIADPQSLIFSPAFLLAYFEAVPTFRQLDAYVLILLGLGALAILKLFQDRNWHAAGGLVAAIAFAFGASAAWRIQHIGQIQSFAFFGIALWLLQRALDRSSARWGALAGLAAGLMIAEPNQVALLGGYVLAAVIASHLWLNFEQEGQWRRSVRPLAWASAAGLVVVVVPLVLCFLYVESSNRPVIDFAEAALGSLNPASLVTTLVGDLYGAFDPAVDYWGPYSVYWDKNDLALSQNMGQLYIGALPIALTITMGLTRGALWAREMRAYTLSILFLVLYALGNYTPAFRLFYEVLPGVAFFRRPADASFLLGGLLAIAGGYVVHLWLNGELRRPGRAGRVIELAVIPLVLVVAIAIAAGEDKMPLAWKPMLNAVGWLVLVMFALVVPMRRFARAGMVAVVVLGVLMTADLAANNGPNESTGGSSANYDILKPNCQNETIKFLKARVRRAPGSAWRDRVELVGLGFEWPNAAMIHGLDTTLGYNPLRIGLVSRAVGARDYIAGPDQRTFSRLFPSYRSKLANLLGLRFVASSIPIEQVDLKLGRGELKFLARTRDAYIYENTEALPRVMFVKDWQHANFERIIEEGRWPEFDPVETVLFDGEPEIAGTWADIAWDVEAVPDVKIKRYENTIVEIEVSAPVDGFVVLNDVWHPWWQAEVDGKPAPIQRANVLFRAVHVAKGRHVVRFEFTPFSGAITELGGKLMGTAK